MFMYHTEKNKHRDSNHSKRSSNSSTYFPRQCNLDLYGRFDAQTWLIL